MPITILNGWLISYFNTALCYLVMESLNNFARGGINNRISNPLRGLTTGDGITSMTLVGSGKKFCKIPSDINDQL
jgi:hypothetical protein